MHFNPKVSLLAFVILVKILSMHCEMTIIKLLLAKMSLGLNMIQPQCPYSTLCFVAQLTLNIFSIHLLKKFKVFLHNTYFLHIVLSRPRKDKKKKEIELLAQVPKKLRNSGTVCIIYFYVIAYRIYTPFAILSELNKLSYSGCQSEFYC